MQKIPLNLAKPGMVLAKAVSNDKGITLVKEETELTETVLERLSKMHVANVVVQGNPVDLDGVAGNDFCQRADRMAHLFRKHGSDPYMMKLKKGLEQYFKLKAAAEAAARKAAEEAEKAAREAMLAEDADEDEAEGGAQ